MMYTMTQKQFHDFNGSVLILVVMDDVHDVYGVKTIESALEAS